MFLKSFWLLTLIFFNLYQKGICATAHTSEQQSLLEEVRALNLHSRLKLTKDPSTFIPCGLHPIGASKWVPSDVRFGVPEFGSSPTAVSPRSPPREASFPKPLGQGITNYFTSRQRKEACLFEYKHFPATCEKSITIYHYGGETKTFLPPAPTELVYKLNEMGSSVFHLRTQDAHNDIHQSNQFSPAGHQLLADSMVSLVLFILDVQKEYPHMPIYYMGCSFGGLKGLLLNAILTHRTSFKSAFQPPCDDIFRNAFKEIYRWPTLSGIICHAPAAERLWKNTVLKRFNVSIATLMLHNFDDERVPLCQSIQFIERSYADGTRHELLWLHAVPQAAKTIKQSPENPHPTSLEGHFFPTHKPYNDDYWKTVERFINPKGNLSSSGIALNEERLIHAKLAYDQFSEHATQEMQERSWLYRLYFLQLKNKSTFFVSKNRIRARAQRFLDCFKMLAYSKCNEDETTFPTHLEGIIAVHGQWLIDRIKQRHTAIFTGFNARLSTPLMEKLKDQPFPSLCMARKEIRTGKISEWLPLLMQERDIEMDTLAKICEFMPEQVIRKTNPKGLSYLDLALRNGRSTEQLIRALLARGLVPSAESLKVHRLPAKVFRRIFT